MHRRRLIPLLLVPSVLAACEDVSYRDIGAEIAVLTQRTDSLVPAATRRLVAHGRRAVPQIEIALHTATPAGKTNLLAALDQIADPESAAILRHFAVYDPQPEVRTACEAILLRWTHRPPLAPAATRALARIAEKRVRGEAPVVPRGAAP